MSRRKISRAVVTWGDLRWEGTSPARLSALSGRTQYSSRLLSALCASLIPRGLPTAVALPYAHSFGHRPCTPPP